MKGDEAHNLPWELSVSDLQYGASNGSGVVNKSWLGEVGYRGSLPRFISTAVQRI